MSTQRIASLLALAATFFALFGGELNVSAVFAAVIAVVGIGVNWWLAERQGKENVVLRRQVAQLEKRSEVEKATAAAFIGQGQLATWNYDRLVIQLRLDGHIA